MKKKTQLALSLAWVLAQAAATLGSSLLPGGYISFAAERSLRVSFPSPTASQLPLWAAHGARLFQKHNVAVELVYVGSSPVAIAALFAGELDVMGGGGEVGVASYLQGYRDVALFASLNNRLNFLIYANPTITDVSGLRGKRLGVTRFGGVMHFAARHFLKSAGLDPAKDVTLIQIGNVQDLAGALIRGSVDAATMPIPQYFTVKKLGFRELADLSQSGVRYASNTFLAKRQFLVDNRTRMERFTKALIEGIHYVKTRRPDALKILSRNTRVTDAEILNLTYDEFAGKVWPQVPEVQPEDVKLVLEQLSERNPKASEIDPSQLIYGDLVKDIVKSGFVAQLYK
jgi:NitT/TauT family transport system substrate-binding protein